MYGAELSHLPGCFLQAHNRCDFESEIEFFLSRISSGTRGGGLMETTARFVSLLLSVPVVSC